MSRNIIQELLDRTDLDERARAELERLKAKHVDPIEDLRALGAKVKRVSFFRNAQWLVATVALAWASRAVDDPQTAQALWTFFKLAGGAYLGYWVSRAMLRGRPHEVESLVIRNEMERNRAIIVGFAMLGACFV